MYIPICFAYIIPVARNGLFNNAISAEHIAIPRKPFVVMGALDCLATSMQIFSSVYLPGPLLVLLSQAVIPCSMVLSRYSLGARYRLAQYLGAVVVLVGILVVLEPVITHRRSPDYYCEAIDRLSDCTVCQVEVAEDACLSHRNILDDDGSQWWLPDNNSTVRDTLCLWLPYDMAPRREEALTFFWSLVMLASTIPMTLSTIYKEVALGGGTELDPIYLNGWIAVFQFFFSFLVAVPAGWLASPSVDPWDLPRNMWDGLLCFAGQHGKGNNMCIPLSFAAVNLDVLAILYCVLDLTRISSLQDPLTPAVTPTPCVPTTPHSLSASVSYATSFTPPA
jgi:drug/metabolite transporter (DMT)-like permease